MNSIKHTVSVLNNNGLIIFPTDTVWGIGCRLDSPEGIKKLYSLKRRETSKPTGIFIRDLKMAQAYGVFDTQSFELAAQYWPGPLALIVKATARVPEEIQGQNQTISLRIPNHPILLELLSQLEAPLVQTSANFSGMETPSNFDAIDPGLLELVECVVAGTATNSLPSTIVDTSQGSIEVLRQGPIKL